MSASYTSRDRCIQALSEGYAKGLKGLLSGPLIHEYGRISEFKGEGFRAVGSDDQGLTKEQYEAVFEVAITRPDAVDDLTLYVPSDS